MSGFIYLFFFLQHSYEYPMGKIRSWLTYVKQLFIPARKPKPEIALVPKTICDTTEEQRKHALTVALATAAAAEAAVTAAKFAATVVQQTNARHEIQEIKTSAAIKIQSAYRAYLVSICYIVFSFS